MVEPAGKRLFVGVRLSVGAANALASAADMLARRARDARQDWRFVAPASYHVTLKYLGWTREETIGAIRDALIEAVAGTPRLTFRASRLGAFPSVDKATVVWAGVDPADAIAALAAKVEAACVGVGFPPEARAFHPHITLARVREPLPIKEVVLPVSEQMFGESRVDEVIVYESDAKSAVSAYRELVQIPLKMARNEPSESEKRQSAPLELGASDDTDDGWPRGHS